MSAAVVDTNVAIVANGTNKEASPNCVLVCIQRLRELRDNGVVVIDDQGLIFDEYKGRLSFKGQPGTGDAFFRHLYQKQYDPAKVERVAVTQTDPAARMFEEFPDDPRLINFHKSDRKFVAVARASVNDPPILNAVDSDWRDFQSELEEHGIVVEQLCPDHWKAR